MQPYLKFPLKFDADRMLLDLERLESAAVWHSHPDYTVAEAGTWTAIALVSTDGDHTGPESLRYKRGAKGEPTKLLAMCPYIREVIESFKTNIHRVRLMSLKPGTDITEHRDYGQQRYSIERGMIRVHMPIRTHEAVAWMSRGEKVPMEAGEAWYVNVCLPHSVKNLSSVNRVHLVLDMKVNAWVKEFFPKQTLIDKTYAFGLKHFEPSILAAMQGLEKVIADAKKWAGDLGLRQLRDNLRSGKRKPLAK